VFAILDNDDADQVERFIAELQSARKSA
jgi:hypothetical protein